MSSTALLSLIQAEFDLMQHFLFSLEKENELLLSNYSNDDLYDHTELKNQYADQLNQAAEQRDNQLTAMGLPTARDGLLAAQSLSDELDQLVQQLFDITEQARTLNEQNGLLIQTYLNYSVEALEALGAANPPTSDVYDARGRTKSGTALKRGIVRA